MAIFKRKNKKKEGLDLTLEELRKAFDSLSKDEQDEFLNTVKTSDMATEEATELTEEATADTADTATDTADKTEEEAADEDTPSEDSTQEAESETKDDTTTNSAEGADSSENETQGILKRVDERIARLEAAIETLTKGKLEQAAEKYGMSEQPIHENTHKSYTEADVQRLLKGI